MMPTVSVIVPNYNHARFLDERLASILNQSYNDLEIIFLDDASTDNSVEVFRKYSGNNNVRAILNDHNSGSTFRQWNRGIQAAKGRYIWIAESDDAAEPQLLETLVPILENNPQVGVAYCNSTIIDEHGAKQYTVDRWYVNVDDNRWSRDYINSGSEECQRYLICRNTIPNASAVVFRKSIYEQCGHASETMTRCGDWWVWTQMLLRSDVAYVAAPLNLFRRHTALSHAISNHNIALEETLQILHEITARLDLSTENEAEMSRRFVDHLVWRQSVANNEVVVLPSTIIYLAALISEQLYSMILDFLYEHNNWNIDWSPTASSVTENVNMLVSRSDIISQKQPAIIAKQHQKLIELKSVRANLRTETAELKSERETLLSRLAHLKWERDHLHSSLSHLELEHHYLRLSLSQLQSEHESLLSSKTYRLAQQFRKVRVRLAPNDSVQYNCLRKLNRLIRRIRKGRMISIGHSLNHDLQS